MRRAYEPPLQLFWVIEVQREVCAPVVVVPLLMKVQQTYSESLVQGIEVLKLLMGAMGLGFQRQAKRR
jgi:hypothetical protein